MNQYQKHNFAQMQAQRQREKARILEEWSYSPEAEAMLKAVQDKRKPTITPDLLPF